MGDGVANGSVIDFGALDGVHFARFVVARRGDRPRGEPLPASLLFLSDLDVSARAPSRQLVDTAGEGIDRLFGHCEGYPRQASGRATSGSTTCAATVCRRQACYVNTVGRTRRQIRQEAELRDAIEEFLDGADGLQRPRSGRGPARACGSTSRPTARSAWALEPPAGLDLGFRLRELVHLVGVPLLVLAAPAAPAPRRAGLPRPAPHARAAGHGRRT